jgi:hypothetical protein
MDGAAIFSKLGLNPSAHVALFAGIEFSIWSTFSGEICRISNFVFIFREFSRDWSQKVDFIDVN